MQRKHPIIWEHIIESSAKFSNIIRPVLYCLDKKQSKSIRASKQSTYVLHALEKKEAFLLPQSLSLDDFRCDLKITSTEKNQ